MFHFSACTHSPSWNFLYISDIFHEMFYEIFQVKKFHEILHHIARTRGRRRSRAGRGRLPTGRDRAYQRDQGDNLRMQDCPPATRFAMWLIENFAEHRRIVLSSSFISPEYVTATHVSNNNNREQTVGQDSKATQDALTGLTAHENYATQKKHNILTNTSKLYKIHPV